MMCKQQRLLLAALPLVVGCSGIPPWQINSPAVPPLNSSRANSPTDPATTIDHGPFDRLLHRHVDDVGLVDYRGLMRNANSLRTYLTSFANVDPANLGTDAERKAYWINAYNAITLAGILHHYPTRSIRDLSGFWKNIKTNCGGRLVSLDDIEHSILRPLGDPRIHMAINCASMSCPRLSNHAYTGAELERQLDTAASTFLADPTRNRYDKGTRVAQLSKIFSWFEEDFMVAPYRGVRGFVRRFAPRHSWLAEEFPIAYLPYDWSLNEQPGSRVRGSRSDSPGPH